jgi:hypothetical protein
MPRSHVSTTRDRRPGAENFERVVVKRVPSRSVVTDLIASVESREFGGNGVQAEALGRFRHPMES